ncbi:MAG: MarR family transcriptional regulator, and catechol-resistance regulon repressor [Actinomycetota bacterium]
MCKYFLYSYRVDPVLSDERITSYGLLLEAAAATRSALDCAGAKWGGMPPSYEILMRLARSEGQRLRMTDLAAQCGLTPSGVSRAVDRLADQDLVRRANCPDDARGAFAEITPKGNKIIVAALKRHVDDLQQVFTDVLTPTQRDQLEDICRTLRDHNNPGYTAGVTASSAASTRPSK